MKKVILKILKIIISVAVAFFISRWIFDSSLVSAICIFFCVWKVSLDDLKKTKLQLPVKFNVCLIILNVIGLFLILLGKMVLHNDVIIIVGAMLFSLIALIVMNFVFRIIAKKKAGE